MNKNNLVILITSEIMDIIDHLDRYSRGEIQDMIQAQVLKAVSAGQLYSKQTGERN